MNEPLRKLVVLLRDMQESRGWSSRDLRRKAGLSAAELRAYETGSESFTPEIAAQILAAMAKDDFGEVLPLEEDWSSQPPQWLLDQMEARMHHLESALRIDEGRLREALDAVNCALALDPRPERRSRVLLTKADIVCELGQPARALVALAEAEESLDLDLEPELWLRLRLLQVTLYCQAQRHAEAESWHAEARELAGRVGSDRERSEVRLLAGWIAAAAGRAEEALAHLREVREELLASRRIVEATAVGIEVAGLLVQTGQLSEISELARRLEEQAGKIPPRARPALKVFCWAARRGTLTAEMASRLGAELRQNAGRLTRPYLLPV